MFVACAHILLEAVEPPAEVLRPVNVHCDIITSRAYSMQGMARRSAHRSRSNRAQHHTNRLPVPADLQLQRTTPTDRSNLSTQTGSQLRSVMDLDCSIRLAR